MFISRHQSLFFSLWLHQLSTRPSENAMATWRWMDNIKARMILLRQQLLAACSLIPPHVKTQISTHRMAHVTKAAASSVLLALLLNKPTLSCQASLCWWYVQDVKHGPFLPVKFEHPGHSWWFDWTVQGINLELSHHGWFTRMLWVEFNNKISKMLRLALTDLSHQPAAVCPPTSSRSDSRDQKTEDRVSKLPKSPEVKMRCKNNMTWLNARLLNVSISLMDDG